MAASRFSPCHAKPTRPSTANPSPRSPGSRRGLRSGPAGIVDAGRQAVIERGDDDQQGGAADGDCEELGGGHGGRLGEDGHSARGGMGDAQGEHRREGEAGGEPDGPPAVRQDHRRAKPDRRGDEIAPDHVGGLGEGRGGQNEGDHGRGAKRRHQERHPGRRAEPGDRADAERLAEARLEGRVERHGGLVAREERAQSSHGTDLSEVTRSA